MLVIKTLTLQQLSERMRDMGMSISTPKIKAAIEQGVFSEFAHKIEMERDEYLIFEKDFNIWASRHGMESQLEPGIQKYLEGKKAV